MMSEEHQVLIYSDKDAKKYAYHKSLKAGRRLHRETSGGCDDWTVTTDEHGKTVIASSSGRVPPIDPDMFFKKAHAKAHSKAGSAPKAEPPQLTQQPVVAVTKAAGGAPVLAEAEAAEAAKTVEGGEGLGAAAEAKPVEEEPKPAAAVVAVEVAPAAGAVAEAPTAPESEAGKPPEVEAPEAAEPADEAATVQPPTKQRCLNFPKAAAQPLQTQDTFRV